MPWTECYQSKEEGYLAYFKRLGIVLNKLDCKKKISAMGSRIIVHLHLSIGLFLPTDL